MNKFSNIKYVVTNYLSIILNDKNKKNFKKNIDYIKSYFFKNNENLGLKEETKNIVEIVLPKKINIEDTNLIDLKKRKESNSILNVLLNKYVIISIILVINYYKRKLINKSSINSNKKSDELDIFNDDVKDNNKDNNKNENKKEYINKDNINKEEDCIINNEEDNIINNEKDNIINNKEDDIINNEENDNKSKNSDNIINNKIIL